jgi:alpha-mannosidase
VERDIQRNPETESWEEMEIVEKPFLDFQAVCHGKRGLAFLSAGGLHEGGVAEDQRRTMQVTLLRSYRRTVATLGEEDGLERGQITYRYNVMPIRAPLPRSEIFHELSKLKAGVMTRQTGDCPSGYPAMTGSLPPEQGFLSLRKGDLVLSAFKQAEDGNGVILRLWNPHPEIRTEELAFWKEIKHAAPVNLGETREEELELSYKERTISVSCPPFKIVTIRANLA